MTPVASTNSTNNTINNSPTTFKVVEFYRNNNLPSNIINNTTESPIYDSSNKNTNGASVTLSRSNSINISNNIVYNTLGFNVIGGYLTEIPVTIVEVAATSLNSSNGSKISKVEEGDIILEINGMSTRHLTLNEVNKQLRCCGNRIYLKIKSDPDYKNRFKQTLKHSYLSNNSNQQYQTLKQSISIHSQVDLLSESSTTASSNDSIKPKSASINRFNSLNGCSISYFNRSTSKSYDNNINLSNGNHNININQPPSASNSHSNILDTSPKSTNNNKSNSSSNLVITNGVLNGETNGFHHDNDLDSNDDILNKQNDQNSFENNEIEVNDTENINNNSNNNNNNNNIDENNMNPIMHQLPSIATTASTATTTTTHTTPVLTFQIEIDDNIKKKIDEKLKECSSGDSDSESEHNVYMQKAVDLPSAQRLAKRLYYLDGFKANDVVRHLSKKNDFSQLVADEYLKLFNFQSLTLDAALRKFLKQFQLVGDAQEKERVLLYFAKRYVDANNTAFTDVDSCHTLTCAIMLLNTDLHDPKIQNKMTLNEFIENLKGLNSGSNFPDVLLESLYSAIKNEPLECAGLDGEDLPYDERGSNNGNTNFSLRPISSNPFLQIPDPHTAKEYKFGWLLRKCCIDSDGKKAAFLKRSWKMFYASLRDMVLYLHKDDKVFKNNTFDNITNAIRIHHAYAAVASDYKKKQFVFRLKTADWAEYLFQTSNATELYEWVSTINLVAAMFSSPPLSGGIGSSKTFQRPLLPVAKTRYTLQEQYEYHKKHIKQLQTDLTKLESAAGACLNTFNHINNTSNQNNNKDDKSFDKDKYNYLKFEIQRYTVYSNILEEKIISENAINSTTTQMPHQLNLINPSFILNDNMSNNNCNGIIGPYNNPLHQGQIYYSNSINHHHNNNNISLLNTNLHHFNENLQRSPNNKTNPNLHVNFNLSPNSLPNGNLQQPPSISISSPNSKKITTSTYLD